MPRLKVNLFKLEPDHRDIDMLYIPDYDTHLISELRKSGLLVGGMASNYLDCEAGIYVIKDEKASSFLKSSQLSYEERCLSSEAYVIKYILADCLRRRLITLEKRGSVILPKNWNKFGEFMFCFPEIVLESKPNGLFKYRKNVNLRIQHFYPNQLYVQVDVGYKRFSNLTLDRVANLLGADNLGVIKGLECSATIRDEQHERNVCGYISEVLPSERRAIIRTETETLSVSFESTRLNSTFFSVKRFIDEILRENLKEVENDIRKRSNKCPVDKIQEIGEIVKEMKRLLFPLEVGSVSYELRESCEEVEIPEI